MERRRVSEVTPSQRIESPGLVPGLWCDRSKSQEDEMSEQPTATIASTGVVLGQYYKDLTGAGIPAEIAEQAVLMAASEMARVGEITISTPVSA